MRSALFPLPFSLRGRKKKGKLHPGCTKLQEDIELLVLYCTRNLHIYMREKPTTTTTSGHLYYPRRPERSAHAQHWIFWALSSYMSCKNMPHTDSQNKITILFSLQFQVANLNVVTWAESDAARCEFTILHMAGVICRVWHECVGLFFSAACVKDFC